MDYPIAYIPVPSNLLPQAMRALAELMDPTVRDGGPDDDVDGQLADGTVHQQMGPNGVGWTSAHLERLAGTRTSGTALVSRLLDVLAESPGEYRPTSVLVQRLDVSQPQLRGALGALTRHLKKHYEGLGWPMDAAWGPELGKGLETYYWVNQEVAGTWRSVRGQDP